MILSLNALLILPSGQVDFWDMLRNLPHRACVQGYHLSPKIVSSVRGFRWKIPISVNLGVSSLPSSAACISAFRVLRTKPSAARWRHARLILAGGSLTPSELADRAWVSSARIANILRALEAKGWVEREHSKTDRRRVHVTVTDKGFQDLEIKRREFEDRTAAFLEQLGETDTQEMVRLLRRANEIIDRNQERRDAE